MRIDTDSLLTRNPSPPLYWSTEFVTQWDCYNKPSSPLSGMLMRFHVHLAYLCEAFHIMSTSPPPRQGSTDSGDPSTTSSYGDGSYTAWYRRSRFYCTGSLRILVGSLPFPDGL
jgi:hypothetical protein